jgi:hypothetical protein
MNSIQFLNPIRLKTLDSNVNNNDTIVSLRYNDIDDTIEYLDTTMKNLREYYKSCKCQDERELIISEYESLTISYKELKATRMADSLNSSINTIQNIQNELPELMQRVEKAKSHKIRRKKVFYQSNLEKDAFGRIYQAYT